MPNYKAFDPFVLKKELIYGEYSLVIDKMIKTNSSLITAYN